MMLDPSARGRLAVLADVLIPGSGEFPSASAAGVSSAVVSSAAAASSAWGSSVVSSFFVSSSLVLAE